MYAQRSYPPRGYCPLHYPVRCQGQTASDKGSDDENKSEDVNENEDNDSEDSGDRIPCTFDCCGSCLHDHVYGDDPSEYC